MCSVVWFIKVTRPLGFKGGGVGAAHAGRGGVQRNLAFVVGLSLCPESRSIEEGEGKPTSSCIRDEPQLHSSSFVLVTMGGREVVHFRCLFCFKKLILLIFLFLHTDKDRRKMAHNFLAQASLIGINK